MTLELTDEEHRALVRLLRRSIDEDRFPLAPRLDLLKAILNKLEPPKLTPPLPPPLEASGTSGMKAAVNGVVNLASMIRRGDPDQVPGINAIG